MRHMKIAALLMFITLLAGVVASAQEYPKAEIAMGYSLVRYSTTGVLEKFTANGGSANLAYNFTKHVGFVADFGGYNNNNIRGFSVDNTMFTYLFGPRFNTHGERINVFGQTLFGGAHISGSAGSLFFPGTVTEPFEESNNSMAFLIGGGFDVNVSKHVAIRPAEFDYLLIRFNPGNQSETQNNIRYSAQIVFKF